MFLGRKGVLAQAKEAAFKGLDAGNAEPGMQGSGDMGNRSWGGKLWERCYYWEGCQETGIEVREVVDCFGMPAGYFTLDWSFVW